LSQALSRWRAAILPKLQWAFAKSVIKSQSEAWVDTLDRRREMPARFPLERNRSSDKKSRQIKELERILIARAYRLLRNSL
jgi:hypothetical protein